MTSGLSARYVGGYSGKPMLGTLEGVMTLAEWLAIGGVSAAISAAVSGIFKWIDTAISGHQSEDRQEKEQDELRKRQGIDLAGQRDRQELDLEGQHNRQEAEHAHQQKLLRQEAHFQARKEAAELVGNLSLWINRELYDLRGPAVDLFPSQLPPGPYSNASEALFDLRRLGTAHPTKSVREQAKCLANEIETKHNTIAPDGSRMSQPTDEDFLDWSQKVEVLIEAINEPPSTKF